MKRRYYTLDAMRGVAAVAVVIYHASALCKPISMPAGYRAVDLFFVLSGFVLAHAYEDRLIGERKIGRFMTQRLIRLYPLYLLGALAGIGSATVAHLLGGGEITGPALLAASVTLLLLLPCAVGNASDPIMPLNLPSWSLFFEVAANILYALIAPVLSTRALIILVSVAFILLTCGGYATGSVDVGAYWPTFFLGFARVTTSFFMGVLLYRIRPKRCLPTHLAWLLILLTVPLLYFLPNNLVADLVCIAIIFPVLILSGARIEVRSVMAASILGDVSYGVYVLHSPLLSWATRAFKLLRLDSDKMAPWSGLSLLLALFISVLVLDKWYDRPVRHWLGRRLHSRNNTGVPERI